MADDGILGMLSGMFSGGQAADPNAPMQILPQVQQDGMNGAAQPSFLDFLKKNGPQALNGAAGQFMQKPAAPPPLPPINYPQARPPQAYGSMMPQRIGS